MPAHQWGSARKRWHAPEAATAPLHGRRHAAGENRAMPTWTEIINNAFPCQGGARRGAAAPPFLLVSEVYSAFPVDSDQKGVKKIRKYVTQAKYMKFRPRGEKKARFRVRVGPLKIKTYNSYPAASSPPFPSFSSSSLVFSLFILLLPTNCDVILKRHIVAPCS